MSTSETYFRGTVVSSSRLELRDIEGQSFPSQDLRVRVFNGSSNPPEIDIRHEGDLLSGDFQEYATGSSVVILYQDDGESSHFQIFDTDRTQSIIGLTIFFLLLVILVARKTGISALIGCAVSLVILLAYMVPQIVAGKDPVWVSLSGSVLIATTSVLIAHGWHKRTHVALGGILLSLCCVVVLAQIAVYITSLTGLSSDELFLYQFGPLGGLNLKGLLLAGILIGALGILDDVATTQAAAVEELKEANPAFGFKELYTRASSIGREHIASLVNTLLLAYVGASFPLFLLLTTHSSLPWWVTLNSEFLAEEIVRTLVGSSGLILAVPITTALAAYVFSRPKKTVEQKHRFDDRV